MTICSSRYPALEEMNNKHKINILYHQDLKTLATLYEFLYCSIFSQDICNQFRSLDSTKPTRTMVNFATSVLLARKLHIAKKLHSPVI